MADHEQIMKGINKHPSVSYPALTPNLKGFQTAVSNYIYIILIFNKYTIATKTFNQNLEITINHS